MDDPANLKNTFARLENRLREQPERGRDTAVTTVRLRDGLTCDIEEGPWKLVADMGRNVGGGETGPTPGVYGRAALGSCMAITYAMWAAKLDVPIKSLEVEIEADFDSGALFGVTNVPAGYSEVRCRVSVESSASRDVVEKLLDTADAHSPYVDVFSRGQTFVRELRHLSRHSEHHQKRHGFQ